MVLWVSLHPFCYNVFYLCSTLSFHFCKHFHLSILGNYIWKQDLSVPHSCPGVYKRINCIRKVSTRNAHGHHLKWDKKVDTIRAASGSGRPADLPKSIFCRASVLLTFLRALWEMCKWPIRPLKCYAKWPARNFGQKHELQYLEKYAVRKVGISSNRESTLKNW